MKGVRNDRRARSSSAARLSSRFCLRQPYGADRIARHCAGGKGATNSYLNGRSFLCASSQSTAPAMPVTTTFLGELQQLVSLHGYWVIGLIVGLESLGLPLPGETILVLAAIYAATEPSFNIWLVIAVAVFGAIMGDNIGYWLGSRYGYALLLRYGERIGMLEPRIKLGQYLFLRHGAKVVFLGRFVALLRILAAFLAGLNWMPWRAFLTANAIGGAIWAAVFGLGGFMFGKALLQLHHALAPIVFALALAGFFGCGYLIRRYEDAAYCIGRASLARTARRCAPCEKTIRSTRCNCLGANYTELAETNASSCPLSLHKQTHVGTCRSPLRPQADMHAMPRSVRFVPKSHLRTATNSIST